MKSLWQQNSLSYCVKEKKHCVPWVEKYFKDCLCNLKDDFSFGFGLVSLVCWGVAEIPQIITNFRTKSSHGVSLLFLCTWVVGDIFNLVGCLLEPATLPTQLYTALLYTTTTILLVLQSVYYDYIYKWWRQRRENATQQIEDVRKPLRPSKTTDHSGIPVPSGVTANVKASPRKDYYYTSARSLAGSATPPVRSILWPVNSGPPALGIPDDSSSSDDEATEKFTVTSQSRPIATSAGFGAFLATSLGMPAQTNAMMHVYTGLTGRKLLQHGQGTEDNVVGQWLGWMMTAIYMGGRIPQIWLNISRGSVEGLNPLMFIFALVANVTYVASILVRTTKWDKIKANLPWLLDAVACVGLDLFIILQYIYYTSKCKKTHRNKKQQKHGAFMEANKN